VQRGAPIPSQPPTLRESQNADTQNDGEANLIITTVQSGGVSFSAFFSASRGEGGGSGSSGGSLVNALCMQVF
jgi:hypothetical protein